jgi:transcriptional regulator with XRE-family HTH domain
VAGIPVNGEALKVIRERSGFSRAALAAKCELDPSYLSLIETGQRRPSPLVMWRLTEALQITAAAIKAVA